MSTIFTMAMVSTIISVLLPGQAAVGRGEHGRQTRAEEVQASDAVHPERGEEDDGVSRSCVLT